MSQDQSIQDFIPFFTHWKNLPHQRDAIQQFWRGVPGNLKSTDAAWYKTWDTPPPTPQKPPKPVRPLAVPYYSQRDSATEHALRMCFSSSCAMMLEFLKPGTLQGRNGDDAYLGRVLRYGDTTDSAAQIKALNHFGLKARFIQNGGWGTIKSQIDLGIPVPIGILHKGPVSAPNGGGHWICVVDYTADGDAVIVHDPFGEIDLIGGTYLNTRGGNLRYSKKNLGPRWMVEGPGTGWAIIAEP